MTKEGSGVGSWDDGLLRVNYWYGAWLSMVAWIWDDSEVTSISSQFISTIMDFLIRRWVARLMSLCLMVPYSHFLVDGFCNVKCCPVESGGSVLIIAEFLIHLPF